MREFFPIHIMVKPEGVTYFPNYIHSQIELLEDIAGAERVFHLVTRLTPKQAELIYPKDKFSQEVRDALVAGETEHYFLHGSSDIYERARKAKGKADTEQGIRGTLVKERNRLNLPFEKWQNFIHTSDTLDETHAICFHFNENFPVCSVCAAKSLCYGRLNGSSMPSTDLSPLKKPP